MQQGNRQQAPEGYGPPASFRSPCQEQGFHYADGSCCSAFARGVDRGSLSGFGSEFSSTVRMVPVSSGSQEYRFTARETHLVLAKK